MQGTNSDFNVFLNNAQYFFALNNEIAELAPSAYNNPNYEDILDLKRIIGHLPFAEQTALINSIAKDPNSFFDSVSYFSTISSETATSFSTNFFKDNNLALSTYLTESEKRLNKGLGCFKKVANDFGYADRMDEEKMLLVSSGINDILAAKTQANFCSVKFLGSLQEAMIKRRDYLFQITSADISKPDPPKSYFAYDSNNKICGINYYQPATAGTTPDEINSLVSGFKEYALCQHSYKNVLSRKVMEIELAITQMSSCIDRDNPNPYAGNSSAVSTSPNITYNSKHEQIGVNNASMIRPDKRTVNNYYLDYGFNFGVPKFESTDSVVINYPKEFDKTFFDIIAKLPINPDDFKDKASKYYPPQFSNRPFSNLHNIIINTKSILDKNYNTDSQTNFVEFVKQLKMIEIGEFACTGNWIIKCEGDFPCLCLPSLTTCMSGIEIDKVKLLKSPSQTVFDFSAFTIYIACENNKQPILLTEANHKILGPVFDFFYQKNDLGTLSQSKTQACFGVFTSGMKNDKDACRDTITEKCGTELDYQCKKSGLYDIINESPVTSSPLPYNCTKTTEPDLDCLRWIDKHFIVGTIAVKPSAFASYNLALQSSMIEKPFINDRDKYCEVNTFSTPVTTNQDTLINLYDNAKTSLFVYKSTLDSPGNIGIEYVETNKEAYNLHISNETFLTFRLIVSLLIILIML